MSAGERKPRTRWRWPRIQEYRRMYNRAYRRQARYWPAARRLRGDRSAPPFQCQVGDVLTERLNNRRPCAVVAFVMQLSENLLRQISPLVKVIVNSAASFIEEQPFGTFVPARTFNEALVDTDALLSFKALGDRLRERNSTHAFYIVKGSGGSPVGFLIIHAQALEDIRSAQYARSAPRQRDDKPRDGSPPARFQAPGAPGSRR